MGLDSLVWIPRFEFKGLDSLVGIHGFGFLGLNSWVCIRWFLGLNIINILGKVEI